jgi:hypothetical protein
MVKRSAELRTPSIDASTRLAPLRLVVAARRREEPTYEQPRLELPLPLPRDSEALIRPREDDREPSPTRGVNVFDMV